MLFTEFNMEDAKRVWTEEAREEERKQVIFNMLQRGMSEEEICAIVECTEEVVDKVKKKMLESL